MAKNIIKPAFNAGTTDKVPRMKLREKNEEAAMISLENGRYKKSEARGAPRMREFDEGVGLIIALAMQLYSPY